MMRGLLNKLVSVKTLGRTKPKQHQPNNTSSIQLDYRLFNYSFRKNFYGKHQYSEFIDINVCLETQQRLRLKKNQELILDFTDAPEPVNKIMLKTKDLQEVGKLPGAYSKLVYDDILRGLKFKVIISLIENTPENHVIWIDLDAYKAL